jgi:hypothetical protein
VTVLVKNTTVKAFVGDPDPAVVSGASIEAKGPLGLTVSASQTSGSVLIAVGGGGSGTAGVAGSTTVNDTEHTTHAWLGIGTEVNVDNAGASATQAVNVIASDHSTATSIAGALAIGGTAGVGLGVDVAVIDKDTQAWIGRSADVTARGNVIVSATSSESILSISAGIGGGGSAARASTPTAA